MDRGKLSERLFEFWGRMKLAVLMDEGRLSMRGVTLFPVWNCNYNLNRQYFYVILNLGPPQNPNFFLKICPDMAVAFAGSKKLF